MKYVLDTSVSLCWVIPRPSALRANQLRGEYLGSIHELIAPAHFPDEIASALTKAERQKLIRVGEAHGFVRDVLSTQPILYPTEPLLDRAVEISSRTRSSYYDCLYVALAEREGCELVTADDKLVKNLQPLFPFIVPLATLP